MRINRELDGQFSPHQFRHLARWNEADCAVEMHLESPIDQVIGIAGKGFAFRRGETIHTESSRKYEIKAFSEFARHHGWHTQRLWTDAAAPVRYLRADMRQGVGRISWPAVPPE